MGSQIHCRYVTFKINQNPSCHAFQSPDVKSHDLVGMFWATIDGDNVDAF